MPPAKYKLTYEQVKEIRKLYQETTLSVRKIAELFEVSKSLVHDIVMMKIYKPKKFEGKDHE